MYISIYIYPGSLKAKLSISFPENLVWCGGTSHLRNGTAWTCISPKILAPQSCEAQDCSVDRMWFLMICVFVLQFFFLPIPSRMLHAKFRMKQPPSSINHDSW